MKKMLLLAAAMLLTCATSFAQWEKPAAPASQALITDGATIQYLYNTAGGFFLGANDWNTRASVSKTKGYKVKVTSTGDGTYSLTDSVETQKAWKKTFCETNQSIWVDNNSGANCDKWTITPADAENQFAIGNAAYPDEYLGVLTDFTDTRLYLTTYFDGVLDGEGNPKPVGYTWYSVSPEAYEAFIAENVRYEAAVKLQAAIEDAEAKYPGIDLAEQKAVYSNTASTTEELNAATSGVDTAIKAYLVNDLKSATVDEPKDATGFINNPSFETGNTTGWTVTNSDDTGAKANSNGTYYCDNTDGDYLFNIWAWGYPITQKITGLPSGIYQLSAGVTSSDDCTNVYIIANGYMTNRSGGYIDNLRKAVTLQANEAGSKQQHLTTGTLYFAVEADSMTIGAVGCSADGVTYTANGKWWYKCDNFQLTYFGQSDEAYQLLQTEDFGGKEVDPEETFACKQLINDYAKAYTDFHEGTTKDQIYEGLRGMFVLADSLDANITAYSNYQKKVDSAKKDLDNFEGVGDYVDLVSAYLGDDVNPGEAPSVEVEETEYQTFPNGSYTYIAENKQLTTPEITAEGEYLSAMVTLMKTKSPYDGMDFTSSIKNPTFADANGDGWTWVQTNVQNFMRTGGYTDFPCAEAWQSSNLKFDVYQDINNVPDGIYEISANAFYRPNGADDVNPENQTINAFIYMNDFESPVKNIGAEGITSTDWDGGVKDEVACGQPLSNTTQGWSYLTALDLYTPGGMKSASQAFSRGMYKQTVYGLVEGGKMRLGIHKTVDDTDTYANDQWCLWTNFTLTYRAQNQEAVESVFEKLRTDAETLIANSEEKLNKEVYDELSEAMDAEVNYQNLFVLNNAIKDARETVSLYDQTTTAIQNLYDALNDAETAGQDPEICEKYNQYYEEKNTAHEDNELNNEQMQEVIAAVPEMVARLKIVGDWTKAKEEDESTWVDLSSLFNSNFDAGNMDGWTISETSGYKGKGYQSASYTGVDGAYLNKFVEAWLANGVALADGRISTVIGNTGYSFMPYLPQGKYTLKADINSQNQNDGTLSGGAYLFVAVGSDTTRVESPSTYGTDNYPQTLSLDFEVTTGDSPVELGIMTENTVYNWLAADNFKLTIRNYGATTPDAIAAPMADMPRQTAPLMYNLAGQRISALRKGVNIVGGKKVLK